MRYVPSSVIHLNHSMTTNDEEYELCDSPLSTTTPSCLSDDEKEGGDADNIDESSVEEEMDDDMGVLNENFVP